MQEIANGSGALGKGLMMEMYSSIVLCLLVHLWERSFFISLDDVCEGS